MGQIVGLKAKPKRCNLNKLSQLRTPAAGEYILVSYDNSMTANGQGNFDCYIVGDGQTAASALPLQSINKAIQYEKIPVTWVDGYYVKNTNELVSNADYRAAQNVPVGSYDKIYANVASVSSDKIVILDENLSVVSSINGTLPIIDLSKYPTAAYISFSNNYKYSGEIYGINLSASGLEEYLAEYIAIGDRESSYVRNVGKELFLNPKINNGYYKRTTNNTNISSATSQCTDFIAIPPSATIIYYTGRSYNAVAGVVFYDKYKNKISHWVGTSNVDTINQSISIPSNAYFCQVCSSTSLLSFSFDVMPSATIETNNKATIYQKIAATWTQGAYINESNTVVVTNNRFSYIHNLDISAYSGKTLIVFANPYQAAAKNLLLDENENILLTAGSILTIDLKNYPAAKYLSLTNYENSYSGEIFVIENSEKTIQEIVSSYYNALGTNVAYIKEITDEFYIPPIADVTGYYLNAGNSPVAFTGSRYSSKYYLIPPSATKVYYTGISYSAARGVLFFDKDKHLISAVAVGNNSDPVSNVEVTIPSGSVYYRISSINSVCNLTFDSPTNEVGGGGSSSTDLSNVLYGKKYVAIGDSFTDSIGSETIAEGPLAGMSKVYPYIIGNRNNMSVINQGASGTVLNGYLLNARYNSIPEDVDYITIWYGINDAGHNIYVGTVDDQPTSITSETSTTTCGGFNFFFKWLLTNRPYAHVGVIITDYATQERREAIIACCKKWGYPYLDLMGDPTIPMLPAGRNSDISVSSEALSLRANAFNINGTTNIHPNNTCHEWQSTFIEAFMRRI